MKKYFPNISITLIIILGFILRVYRIGYYSLWNDESGQLIAALQPTIFGMIEIMKTHAMAMPLDYLITRLISHFTLSEGFLRLPSAIWGTLSILFFYLFLKNLLGKARDAIKISLISALIFALSSIHIYYSQEMRFYAALGTFYWLSNLLLLKFIKLENLKSWLFFIFIFTLGIFFHPYVLIAVLNGFLLFFFTNRLELNKNNGTSRIFFGKTGILLFLASLLGLICFSFWLIINDPSSQYSYDIWQHNDNLFKFLLQGIGWMAIPFCDQISLFGYWEIFLITFSFVGICLIYLRRIFPWHFSYLMSVLVGQIVVIAAINYLRGYWLLYRQIIHVSPILIVPVSVAINELIKGLHSRMKKGNILYHTSVITLILLIVFLAYMRLNDYYKSGKSNASQIVKMITQEKFDEKNLMVIPGYETKIYEVYSKFYYQDGKINITPTSLEKIKLDEKLQGVNYIVFPSTSNYQNQLTLYGYKPIFVPEESCSGLRALFSKDITK